MDDYTDPEKRYEQEGADDVPDADDHPRRPRQRTREDDEEKKGVAGFMQRAQETAGKQAKKTANEKLMRPFEHKFSGFMGDAISEGRLFSIADAVGDYQKNKIDVTDTTCEYCAVGCRFDVYTKDGEFLGTRPNPEKAPVNGISTCVKGKFAHGYTNSDDRLRQPLVKEDGEFREASWDEALERVKEGLSGIKEEYDPNALGLVASSKATNEDCYVMQRFAREVINTNNIDNCNRLCHAATVSGLSSTVGFGAASSGLEALEESDCYLMTGTNTTENHPVFATRIKQNVKDNDADLLVFDPRKVQMAEYADQYSRVEPGYDNTWINGLIRYILKNDLHDEEYIEERVDGFEQVEETVDQFTPEFVEEKAGVPEEELVSAAETIAEADSCLFCWTLGIAEQTHATENIYAIANLALITGNVGHPTGGLSPFRGQNNVQGGGGDMGPVPNNFPGYQPVTNEDNREKFAEAYEMDLDEMPANEGYRITDMFLAADNGDLHGMFIQGENPLISEPNIPHAQEVLEEKLDFLAVQDIFLTDTAKHADVVLPATASLESNGTYTGSTRHVQLVKRALEPAGNVKPDWKITQELAQRFGYDWDYSHPSEIMDEIADLTPIYAGVSHERLETIGEGGLQWPVWDKDHDGTPYLYQDDFQTSDGMAHMHPADTVDPGETPDDDYPIVMTSGRVLYQYHTGTMSFRDEGAMSYTSQSFVEIHPDTAEEYGISNGDMLDITSRHGETQAMAQVTRRPSPGEIFIPMHFLDGGANNLTKEDPLDGPSRAPEYKVTDVQLSVTGQDSDASAVSVPSTEADDRTAEADD